MLMFSAFKTKAHEIKITKFDSTRFFYLEFI